MILTLALLAGLGGGSDTFAVTAAKVVTCDAEGGTIDNAAVLVRDGRIAWIGPATELQLPEGAPLIDGGSGWLSPGLVDLHSHVGSWRSGDLNDSINPTNPGLRNWDVVHPGNPDLERGIAAGVTTTLFIPGSGSNMGGFGTLIKTAGESVEAMSLRTDETGAVRPGALKIAQAGNPERRDGNIGRGRMGMNWGLRQTLQRGKDYADLWAAWEAGKAAEQPEVDTNLEYMRGLFGHEYPVAVHSQIFQVVQMTARMLHDEFGLDVVLDHSTFDGWKNAPVYAERGIPVIHGPRVYDPWAMRYEGVFRGTANSWYEGGVTELGVNTDAPVLPQEDFFLQASLAARTGLPHDAALRALTIVPARAMGVADRIGSIKVGKDADLVLFTGDPLDARSSVVTTWIEGRAVYDAARDGQRY